MSTKTDNERQLEICICAAVKWRDKVWRGHRHKDCISAMNDELSYKYNRKQLMSFVNLYEDQGFITSKNRYVTREEGRKLQDAAGIPSASKGGYRGTLLFSEDLY